MCHHHTHEEEHTCRGCCGSHSEEHPSHTCHGEGHTCGGCCGSQPQIVLSDEQVALLQELAQVSYLPLTRLTLASTRSGDLLSVALAPVFLQAPDEPMERVKQTGAWLLELEKYGLISLDYNLELKGYDYRLYEDSDVFALLRQTVEEGKGCAGFLYDLPCLERGSMALTELGYQVVDRLG